MVNFNFYILVTPSVASFLVLHRYQFLHGAGSLFPVNMGSDRRTCRISSYRNRNQTGINPKISRTGPELDFCDLIDLPGDHPGPSAKSPEIPKPAGQIAMTAGAGTDRTAGQISGPEIIRRAINRSRSGDREDCRKTPGPSHDPLDRAEGLTDSPDLFDHIPEAGRP